MKWLVLVFLMMGRSFASDVVTLKTDVGQFNCTRGSIEWAVVGVKLPTHFVHARLKATFSSQIACYKFVIEVVEKYGWSVDLPVEIQTQSKEEYKTETYEYNCRWMNGGLAGPRQYCSKGTRQVKWINTTETVKVILEDVMFTSVVTSSSKVL